MDDQRDAKEALRQYVRDRDDAVFKSVETDSIEPFKEFAAKYKSFMPPCFNLAADSVLEVTVRKMAYHCINLPQETRDKAEAWLLSHGSNTDLD